MKLGEVGNADAQRYGKPLEGVRVLAAEQMQALPFGTQLMTRLGAEVVKIEHPVHGESGRGALPAMDDPQGRRVGATFLRNNLNKRSVGLDIKSERGRDLFLQLVPHFDVVAENFKAGAMARLGLGYEDVAKVDPKIIYLSISGFGNTVETPYDWPAYAPIVEAMSGIYEYKRPEDQPPVPAPAGALGDIGTSMFGVIDVLADPHVEARNMLVELPRTDDVDDPVLIPGNPVKLSKMADGPETRVPWVGEHTDEVLHKELGLSDTELADLRAAGVIS